MKKEKRIQESLALGADYELEDIKKRIKDLEDFVYDDSFSMNTLANGECRKSHSTKPEEAKAFADGITLFTEFEKEANYKHKGLLKNSNAITLLSGYLALHNRSIYKGECVSLLNGFLLGLLRYLKQEDGVESRVEPGLRDLIDNLLFVAKAKNVSVDMVASYAQAQNYIFGKFVVLHPDEVEYVEESDEQDCDSWLLS